MAERDVFNFQIGADNQKAKEAFTELKQLAKEVSEASSNLTASPGINRNFSNLIKEMTEAQIKYTEFKTSMDENIQIKTSIIYDTRADADTKRKAQESINAMRQQVKRAREDFMVMNNEGARAITNYERTTGRKGRAVPKSSFYLDDLNATERSHNFVNSTAKSIKSETQEALRIGRSALSSKFINNNNASTYKRITGELLSEDVQGASIDQIRSGQPIDAPTPGSLRHQIMYEREQAKERGAGIYANMTETAPTEHMNRLEDMNNRYGKALRDIDSPIRELESKKAVTEQTGGIFPESEAQELEELLQKRNRIEQKYNLAVEEETIRHELQMSAFRKEFKLTEDVVQSTTKTLDLLDDSAKKLAEQVEEVTTANVRQKHDRDEWQGRVSERASAIGLAVAGAMAYAVGSRYSSGKQTVDSMREDSLNIGYRTGNADFRGIRQDYMEQGAPQGWKGQDMIAFSEAVLGSLGYIDGDNLTSNMQNIADFSKFSGAGQESATAFTSGLLSTGGITDADQARAVQEGFIGAIKASGMEGREREQLDAVTAINDNIYRGREASEEEINSRNAMMAVLAGTGNRGLQGENLADFMMGADNAIKGADPFSNMGMLLGVGSDEAFSGTDWLYEFMKIQEQGFSPENFNTILQNLTPMTDGSPEAIASQLKALTGVSTGVEPLRDFIAKYPDGVPIGADGEALLKELEVIGAGELDTRESNYMESGDQSAQAQEAYLAKMDSLLNDNAMIDSINSLKESFGDWASDSAGRAIGTSIAIGLGAGIGSFLTGVIGTMMGTVGLKMFSKTLFGEGSPIIAKLLGKFGAGAGGAGAGAGAGGIPTVAPYAGQKIAQYGAGGAGSGGGGLFSGGGEALAGGLKGGASKVMSTISKVAPWLMVMNGMYQTATADDKVKEGYTQAGGIGGALVGGKAGAVAVGKLGATIGTTILPGIGTAIGATLGGLAGGIGGYFLGSKGGEAIGTALSPQEKAKREEAERLQQQADAVLKVKGTHKVNEDFNSVTEQEEKSTVSQRVHAEQLRDSNIIQENKNLSKYETLLAETRRLLQMSATQNGIIGFLTGLPSGGSGGASGQQKAVGDGRYWTNSDITKHDLGSTSNELSAQELNDWINSKAPANSIMRGMGEAFMTAGQESGLDPRYLVAHSALETGWGTSNIARDKGNMYGIGAFDASPYASAYEYSGTEAGIIEGAKWIRGNYYDKGNTDLTKMHEAGYATDPEWASKIGNTMKGAEKYTSPSQEVNVNTTVNYQGTGDTTRDAERIGTVISNNISATFRHERIRA